MSKPALPPPSPTHLGRHITRCPKGIHTAVVFSRTCDTRAHPWTFALFAFTTFTEQQKIRTIFSPKTEDKNRAKKCPTLPQKRRRFSQKRGRFLKKRGRFSRKCRTFFLEILGNPPNSTKTLRPLSHKNRGKESHLPKTSLLPSTFFYRKHRKSVSHSAPKSPISALDFPFSTSILLTSAKKLA